MNSRYIAILALILIGWIVWKVVVADVAADLVWPLFGVIGLSIWPVLAWLRSGAQTVPAIEMFSGFHFIYYALPVIEQHRVMEQFSPVLQARSLVAVCLFLACVQLAGYRLLRRGGIASLPGGVGINRRIPDDPSNRLYWWILAAWVAFEILVYLRAFPDISGVLNIARTLATGLGAFSTFYFSYSWGSGRLMPAQKRTFVIALMFWLLLEFCTGFLVEGAKFLVLAMLGFLMGGRRLPVLGLALSLLVISVLHLGKGDMRQRFWEPGTNYSSRVLNPLEVYPFWIGASWNRLTAWSGDGKSRSKSTPTNIFERGSLTNMLAVSMREVPGNREYLLGQTYYQLPLLLVPRVLWPNKPRGTLPSETLAIHVGVQTKASVEYTSVGMGQIAEGWVNFGWPGVVFAGLVFGSFLSFPQRLSIGSTPRDARFLVAIASVALATDLEHCLGQWVTIMLQSTIAAGGLAVLLTRRVSARALRRDYL